ncbi:MAG: alpha-amylase family glycosyl hydrolase, partial [Prolixibacteraceae bacterium]
MTPSNTDFIKMLEKRLRFIYKENYNESVTGRITNLAEQYRQNKKISQKWSEKDIVLITYGDSIKKENELPLTTLKRFLDENLREQLSVIHVLPFFPYSSDDGFSVIDFRKVNPELGTWKEIEELTENFDLMVDLVINHASGKSEWFQNFLQQSGKGKDFFITENPDADLSEVIRPRSSPLLTPYKTKNGVKHVWTTFSADQVDLNFANPELLIEMVDILLGYISKGARIIRLDAIAFLWKKTGTSCLHLPETHEVVKLLREIAEFVNPSVVILTETNVPNKENLSYFGNGDEAHMVYQFSLPPLLLHALHTGNSKYLNKWAQTLPEPPNGCTFFNFTASHDGIGLRPLEGLIPEEEKEQLATKMQEFGGMVNYRSKP